MTDLVHSTALYLLHSNSLALATITMKLQGYSNGLNICLFHNFPSHWTYKIYFVIRLGAKKCNLFINDEYQAAPSQIEMKYELTSLSEF